MALRRRLAAAGGHHLCRRFFLRAFPSGLMGIEASSCGPCGKSLGGRDKERPWALDAIVLFDATAADLASRKRLRPAFLLTWSPSIASPFKFKRAARNRLNQRCKRSCALGFEEWLESCTALPCRPRPQPANPGSPNPHHHVIYPVSKGIELSRESLPNMRKLFPPLRQSGKPLGGGNPWNSWKHELFLNPP
ncbi:hypothetical protein CH063_11951 [Colletotrichum higginsianum]|uniref:Uncharacterized protein n=1 Tax=Colletotrichum higginsianum (strain IMI 349063) TaxID=759273 RepID=H1VNH3_COLHI|nr:hypothetical protein CH063_11951 [Colletotrichum higginsianum]